jgi:hypothetical protein
LPVNAVGLLKNYRNISLLLLLTVAIMLAHSAAPHHHHRAEHYCPDSQPCHILSQVVFLECQLLDKYRHIRPLQPELNPGLNHHRIVEPVAYQCIVYFPGFPVILIPLISPLQLRAPPLSA